MGRAKRVSSKFLTENKNVLLHGSANQNLEVLESRQSNDVSKKSGNKNAVYGVTDPVLPIFYAIQDRKKLQGAIESGIEIDDETGKSVYKFRIPIKPIAKLEVKPEDFRYMDNIEYN